MKRINSIFKGIVRTLVVLGLVMALVNHIQWKNNIYNPSNQPFILEIQFNSDSLLTDKEIQQQFNSRYLSN